MKHRLLALLLLIGIFTPLMAVTSCAADSTSSADAATSDAGPIRPIRSIADLVGARIGTLSGYDSLVRDDLHATPVFYTDTGAALHDVRHGRLDGLITSRSAAQVVVSQDPDLAIIEVPEQLSSASIAAFATNQAAIDPFNAFLAAITTDGTLAEMQSRWFSEDADLDAPPIDLPGEGSGTNGRLVIATSGTAPPYAFEGYNDQLNGFSIELARRYAIWAGKQLTLEPLELSGLLAFVESGKADLGLSNVSISPEHQEKFRFSDPINTDLAAVLVRGPATSDATESAAVAGETDDGNRQLPNPIASLQRGIYRNLIEDGRWKMVTRGLGVTLIIALAAQIISTILGAGLCYVLLCRNRLATNLGKAYCAVINGTPLVVVLMIIYYVIFGSSTISNVLVAIVAFSLVRVVTVAQTMKTGISSVDPMEIEAARGIGFSAFAAFKNITLPQAFRDILPRYLSGFVDLVKATAIVGYIAIIDLTRAGDLIRSRTYDAYFPLILVALIYLVVTKLLVFVFNRIIHHFHVGAVA